jgi:hypothetical protein
VEVEVPDILDKAEHDYLEAVIKPWKEKVTGIQKWTSDVNTSKEFIVIEVEGEKMNVKLALLILPELCIEVWKQAENTPWRN